MSGFVTFPELLESGRLVDQYLETHSLLAAEGTNATQDEIAFDLLKQCGEVAEYP